MYTIYSASPVTLIVVVGTLLVVPCYVLATFVFSGASARKGAALGALCAVWGGAMCWVCLARVPRALGLPGQLIVPLGWLVPSLLLLAGRRWVLARPLDQRMLVGLQVFRLIGAVFLLEMPRHVPAVFAWPAGLGDIAVGLIALIVLLRCPADRPLPRGAILLVAAAGLLDFAVAFFFGFTSAPGPAQLFHPPHPSRLIEFPTGMIPLFLVPVAIAFHTLSLLSLRARGA